MSWAIPYFAGLLTPGLQTNPDANRDDLYLLIEKTATANSRGIQMVNPAGFVAAVRR